MAGRIYLGNSKERWEGEKAKFSKYATTLEKPKTPGIILFVSNDAGPSGVSTSRFIEHLLDIHAQYCLSCNESSGTGETSCAVPYSLGQNPTASTCSAFIHDISPIRKTEELVGLNLFSSVAKTPITKKKQIFTSTPRHVARSTHTSEVLTFDSDSDEDDQDEENIFHRIPVGEEVPGYIRFSDLNMSMEEVVLDFEQEEEEEEEEEEEVQDEKEAHISSGYEDVEDAKKTATSLINEDKCIVYINRLMSLLKQVNGTRCKKCKGLLTYRYIYKGTCAKVLWECPKNHSESWDSQPTFRKQCAGNLQLAIALLFSGNSYSKTALMFKFMNLKFFSSDLFYRIQRLYAAPAINSYWEKQRGEILTEIRRNKPNGVVLSTDARMDSPGFCAQYCTNTFSDDSDKIIHFEIVEVREAMGKSTNMEKLGFQKGLRFLRDNIQINEVVTDAHPQIIALMKSSNELKDILHQIDVWHGGKNLSKRLSKVAKLKANSPLQAWISSIKNHFWHSASDSNGCPYRMKAIWLSILHHIVDEHEWDMNPDGTEGKCDHDTLDERDTNKAWLTKGSPPHQALKDIVVEKRFLKMFPYYTHFRHTGNLESFHNHLLMYAPKRHAYHYEGYTARNQLAAIDHNSHIGRSIALDKDGKEQSKYQFNKRSKQWVLQPLRSKKQYTYIKDMMFNAFMRRFEDKGSLQQKSTAKKSIPLQIHSNRFMVEQPPKKEFRHISRFDKGQSSGSTEHAE